jgi:hypothetical protein
MKKHLRVIVFDVRVGKEELQVGKISESLLIKLLFSPSRLFAHHFNPFTQNVSTEVKLPHHPHRFIFILLRLHATT